MSGVFACVCMYVLLDCHYYYFFFFNLFNRLFVCLLVCFILISHSLMGSKLVPIFFGPSCLLVSNLYPGLRLLSFSFL